MKSNGKPVNHLISQVTLCVRVWIEIATSSLIDVKDTVTLCVRVWIEIFATKKIYIPDMGSPSA